MVDIDMSLNYCYFLIFDDQRHAKVSKKSVNQTFSSIFFLFLQQNSKWFADFSLKGVFGAMCRTCWLRRPRWCGVAVLRFEIWRSARSNFKSIYLYIYIYRYIGVNVGYGEAFSRTATLQRAAASPRKKTIIFRPKIRRPQWKIRTFALSTK